MKKRIYVVEDRLFYLRNDNEVFEIEVENDDDRNVLQDFSMECNKNCEMIPAELYECDFVIDWSKIEFKGNEYLIKEFSVKNNKTNHEKPEIIVYIDYYENTIELRKINKYCIRNRIKLLPFIVMEDRYIVGPYIIPGETCCYQCKYQRMINNGYLEEKEVILRKIFENNINKACSKDDIMMAKIIFNQVLKKIFTEREDMFINAVIEISISKLNIEKHILLPWPKCECRELKWIY